MSEPYDSNRYVATILRHKDGDTTYCDVDWGGDTRSRLSLRWASIDAPELPLQAGVEALAMVKHWIPVGSTCLISTTQDPKEKFGRYLATFWLGDQNLNKKLVDLGHAVTYDGGKR